MNKDTLIKVTNRDTGRVGYTIPELNVRRQFAPKETKEITFGELSQLSYIPGGMAMLSQYLVIKDDEAIKELLNGVEPEYFYDENDIIRIMTQGSLNEFLDMLDFAPKGVLEIVKDLAVSLPLDNMSKREAILEKLEFDVTNAINIQNTKFDGGDDAKSTSDKPVRRAATPTTSSTTTSARRAATPPVYNRVNK